MKRGVSRGVMDISGQRCGTDHIITTTAEVCQLLKCPLEDQSKCVCSTLIHLFAAPARQEMDLLLVGISSLKSLLWRIMWTDAATVLHVSNSIITTHGKQSSPVWAQHFLPPFLSPSAEKVKWPHMSQSVCLPLSGRWCMRTEISMLNQQTTLTHTNTRITDDTSIHGPDLGFIAWQQGNFFRLVRKWQAGDLQLQQVDVFSNCGLVLKPIVVSSF